MCLLINLHLITSSSVSLQSSGLSHQTQMSGFNI